MAPGADDGSQGGAITQTQHAAGTPPVPKPTRKRASSWDDAERWDFERDDDKSKVKKYDISTPAVTGGASASTATWDGAQDQAMNALADSSRERDMEVVRAKLGCKVDVGEIYSPPRVVTVAETAGLRKGFSLDLTCARSNGRAWDFSQGDARREALQLVNATKPYLLIGSPPCTAWSLLQNLEIIGQDTPRD